MFEDIYSQQISERQPQEIEDVPDEEEKLVSEQESDIELSGDEGEL